MPKITRRTAVRYARQLDKPVWAPGPDGDDMVIAAPGDWATYVEKDDELVFKGFVSDEAYHKKHCQVV